MRSRRPVGVALFGLAVLAAWQPLYAQATREKELEDKVQMLEQRLAQVEKRISSSGASRGEIADDIEKRLTELEKKYEAVYGPNSFRVYWKDGLRFDTSDKAFQFKIGGRIQNDWTWYGDKEDVRGELEDGTEFRRARISMSGVIYHDVEFKAEYDFAGGDADFRDVYIGLRNVPFVGNIRVGQFKEPFSLEQLESANYITFMERSLITAFVPDRNTGFMAFNTLFSDRMTWAVGVFRDSDDYGDDPGHDGDYSYTGRVTFLPWYAEDGKKLLHVGLAYSHRSPQDRVLRLRERPEAHLAPRFLDTGNFGAKRMDLLGLETALVYGPFSVQSEYVQAWVDAINTYDTEFCGAYVQLSYFLTGEHRPYDRKAGTFTRVHPKKNFGFTGGDRGWGAWEVAARYSFLDLDDRRISGSEMSDFTLGLNWYLNPNTRVMWNYVFADLSHEGDASIFEMRFQIDF